MLNSSVNSVETKKKHERHVISHENIEFYEDLRYGNANSTIVTEFEESRTKHLPHIYFALFFSLFSCRFLFFKCHITRETTETFHSWQLASMKIWKHLPWADELLSQQAYYQFSFITCKIPSILTSVISLWSLFPKIIDKYFSENSKFLSAGKWNILGIETSSEDPIKPIFRLSSLWTTWEVWLFTFFNEFVLLKAIAITPSNQTKTFPPADKCSARSIYEVLWNC